MIDTSISRHHCQFHLYKNVLIIEDTRSKYGSLVKVKEPVKITPNHNIQFQVGNTLLDFRYSRSTLCSW